MRLVRPTVVILSEINQDEVISTIAQVARTCYKSESNNTSENNLQLVKNLLKLNHGAMLEFYDITVKFTCSRAVSHELVRHRLASFAQESQRYCNYSKDKFNNQVTFIIPLWANVLPGAYESLGEVDIDSVKELLLIKQLRNAENSYLQLLNAGLTAQEAREVLPNSTKTEINMKANLREWRHFFELRCSKKAHPEMRYLAIELLKQMYEVLPVIFEDLYTKYANEETKV